MQTIEVDDRSYHFIMDLSEATGASAPTIIRRWVDLHARKLDGSPAKPSEPVKSANSNPELSICLDDPRLRTMRKAEDRFLHLLSCVHKQNPSAFVKVLTIQGRSRKYFTNSKKEIEESGTGVNPKPIPETSFWVDTNNDTNRKAEMLSRVLNVLGYKPDTIRRARKIVESTMFSDNPFR
jgi:negative modulator of initiation of replication